MSIKRAFTLIELLVVILIIAVVSAIVIPTYSKLYEKARFDSAVRDVKDIFAYAKERAITNDTIVSLTFDRSTETFSVASDPLPQQSDLPTAHLADQNGDPNTGSIPAASRRLQLNPEFQITGFQSAGGSSGSSSGGNNQISGLPEIHFRGDGTLDKLEKVSFVIVGLGRNSRMVLTPSSGRLTEQEEPNHPQ